MVKPLEIDYTGAVYHVISGGNDRKKIFAYNQERDLYCHSQRGRDALYLDMLWITKGNAFHIFPDQLRSPSRRSTFGIVLYNLYLSGQGLLRF